MDPFNNSQGEHDMIILASNIIKSFNSVIANYLKDGYVISPFSMKGSYTDAKSFVDLVRCDNVDHIIRVWLYKDHIESVGTSYHYIRYIHTKSILVKKYDCFGHKTNMNDIAWPHTLWPNEGTLIKEIKYYEFANRGDKPIYTDSLDEATAYFKIRSDRYSIKRDIFNSKSYQKDILVDQLPSKFVNNIMDRIHAVRGFKRATKDCISNVTVIKDSERFKSVVRYSFNGKTGIINLH